MNVCDNLGDHLVGNVYIKVQLTLRIYNVIMMKKGTWSIVGFQLNLFLCNVSLKSFCISQMWSILPGENTDITQPQIYHYS